MRPLATFILAFLLVACAGDPADAEGGMGVPMQLPGETYPGQREVFRTELDVTDTGCLHVLVDGVSRFAIWPAGSELADALRLPDGSVLADGDRFEALGAATPAAPLKGDGAGYWGNSIGFCDPEADVVIVLDEVRPLD